MSKSSPQDWGAPDGSRGAPSAEPVSGGPAPWGATLTRPKIRDRVLGIDPGSLHLGYGVIELSSDRLAHVASGVISPKSAWVFADRLKFIFEGLSEVHERHAPSSMALEDIFVYKNPRSVFKLAEARGVAILAAALNGVQVYEYAPQLIKNAVCGNARAEKSQIAFMVGKLLNLTVKLATDASDALAASICHAGQSPRATIERAPGLATKGRAKSWRGLTPQDLANLGYKVENAPK
ncbi:MAG: crossover junction endodeoxyribonuclease RuvC [Deltaproteobacteria bacterium]|jgi:crossover junction endodeoxyribonuclease RuvC|nr:crossover junction endodeoxyribonuclease RuvC [Deltaproteobacteria bacterium]